MASTLDTITNLIQSPPGQLAAGGVLAGIVWKFFERVEAVLTEDTKLEIAVWLLGVTIGPTVQSWPQTFGKVFDQVFGASHLSWRCVFRCCAISMCVVLMVLLYAVLSGHLPVRELLQNWQGLFIGIVLFNFCPDYAGVFVTRLVITALKRDLSLPLREVTVGRLTIYPKQERMRIREMVTILILFDLALKMQGVIALMSAILFLMQRMRGALGNIAAAYKDGHVLYATVGLSVLKRCIEYLEVNAETKSLLVEMPLLFTSIWLWLYAGAGFLLKAARRFDIGFDWFNRKFDIEKKPLQSIGLVAGALVAVVYWSAVVVSRVL